MVGLRVVAQLAQRKARSAVGAFAFKKGLQACARHPFDEANAPHAGKFNLQVARIDVGAEGMALDGFLRAVDAAHSAQAVQRHLELSGDFFGGAVHPALEGGVRVGYTWGNGKYDLAAYGRNITNQQRIVGGIDFNNLTGFINEPRTFGVSFKANF